MPPTTFVTGGTGFLGRHLVPALCRAGHTVRVLTRDPAAHPWLARYPRIEIIRGGHSRCGSRIDEAVAGCTYVVHAAGLFRFWGSKEAFEPTNVGGTENVLRAAVRTPIKKLIYVSTVAVIGTPEPKRIVDEESSGAPSG